LLFGILEHYKDGLVRVYKRQGQSPRRAPKGMHALWSSSRLATSFSMSAILLRCSWSFSCETSLNLEISCQLDARTSDWGDTYLIKASFSPSFIRKNLPGYAKLCRSTHQLSKLFDQYPINSYSYARSTPPMGIVDG
jgi:hypothetical protein